MWWRSAKHDDESLRRLKGAQGQVAHAKLQLSHATPGTPTAHLAIGQLKEAQSALLAVLSEYSRSPRLHRLAYRFSSHRLSSAFPAHVFFACELVYVGVDRSNIANFKPLAVDLHDALEQTALGAGRTPIDASRLDQCWDAFEAAWLDLHAERLPDGDIALLGALEVRLERELRRLVQDDGVDRGLVEDVDPGIVLLLPRLACLGEMDVFGGDISRLIDNATRARLRARLLKDVGEASKAGPADQGDEGDTEIYIDVCRTADAEQRDGPLANERQLALQIAFKRFLDGSTDRGGKNEGRTPSGGNHHCSRCQRVFAVATAGGASPAVQCNQCKRLVCRSCTISSSSTLPATCQTCSAIEAFL